MDLIKRWMSEVLFIDLRLKGCYLQEVREWQE